MQFCDECGSMMHTDGEQMVCSDCGHATAKAESLSTDYVSTERQDDSDVIETTEDANFEGKPTDDTVRCDECGHGIAWYTIKQTGSADEPPTRFFKCKRCKSVWRAYD
ncbi:transcription factor S [Halobacteriales archaeon SW_6_65_46]|nr:MAG: transcription factor S [Halobacteriales archaeon SW_6_65_46]